MSVMEVWINEKSVAVVGGSDFDLLTFGVLAGHISARPSLVLTGWRKATDEHCQWLNSPLHSGDKIRMMLHGNKTLFVPARSTISPEGNAAAVHSEIHQRVDERAPSKEKTGSSLRLRIGVTQTVRASAGNKANLYATATWRRADETCKIELWCDAPDKKDENQFWAEWCLDPDQLFEVEVIS